MDSEEKIKKMEALVSLIDEPDLDIYRDISSNIFAFGIDIIPILENAWEQQFTADTQQRIEGLIHEIRFDQLQKELSNWINEGATDLLQGCLIVASYAYPQLNEDDIHYDLGRLRKDIWLELNENLTALEQIKVFNYVFYDMLGFHGNIKDYHDPENSFINKVLETKTGNPLSMGILYLILAQSLEIPVKGVNLPEHFVLAYTGATLDPDTLEYNNDNILFYINAFSKGSVFSVKDIEVFLQQIKHKPKNSYFQPCDNKAIILRMLHNLMLSYKKAEQEGKAKEIEFLTGLFSKK